MKWTTSCASAASKASSSNGRSSAVAVRMSTPGFRSRGHLVHTDPADELDGQRAGTTADVEHALAGRDAREIGERHRQRPGVPPHEPVVRVGSDGEAHRPDPTPTARRTTTGNATRVVEDRLAELPRLRLRRQREDGDRRPPTNDTEM